MIDVQEMEKETPRYLKLKDAASLLGVKYPTLRAYAMRHGLLIERFPMDANIYLRVEDIEWLREARAKLHGV